MGVSWDDITGPGLHFRHVPLMLYLVFFLGLRVEPGFAARHLLSRSRVFELHQLAGLGLAETALHALVHECELSSTSGSGATWYAAATDGCAIVFRAVRFIPNLLDRLDFVVVQYTASFSKLEEEVFFASNYFCVFFLFCPRGFNKLAV